MHFKTEYAVALQGHLRSLISVPIESAYATSVINGKFGPILPRFRDIAGFLLKTATFLFHPNFGRFLVLDWRCVASRNEDPISICNVM